MKLKPFLTMAATAAFFLQSALAVSKLPEFRTPEQLQAHRAQQMAAYESKKAEHGEVHKLVSQVPTFYTGKINETEAGKYLFMFRTYNPELLRWNEADPIGFPDGPNNRICVNNGTTTAFDPTGKQITLYQKPVLGQLFPQSVHSYIYFSDIYACGGTYNWTGSISGQPEHNPPTALDGFGDLRSQPGSDNNSARNAAVSLNFADYGYVCEWWFYQDLMAASQAYDNFLAYRPLPTSIADTYNSNGYIHGILAAIGVNVSSTAYTQSAGWSRAIPLDYSSKFKIDDGYKKCCE